MRCPHELIDELGERGPRDRGGLRKEARGGEARKSVHLEQGDGGGVAGVADDEIDAGEVAAAERLVCGGGERLDAPGELRAERRGADVDAAAGGVAGLVGVEGVAR